MSHRAHGKGDRLRYQLGLVLWLLSTGVCKCHLGIAQHRIPGGEMVEPREYMYRFVMVPHICTTLGVTLHTHCLHVV